MSHQRRICVSMALLALLAGCANWVTTPTPEMPILPTASPTLVLSPTPTVTATPFPDVLTLSLWVPEFLDPQGLDERADALRDLLAAFPAMRPGVQVEVIAKKDQGDGGLYHLMSTAYDVAPSILPDLIILNQADFQVAMTEGYLQPMRPVFFDRDDYFRFALEGVEGDTGFYGFPMLTLAPHFVYRAGLLASPPLTWTTVLTEGYSMLFPAGPSGGIADDALVILYLAAGGRIQDEQGRAVLERADLEELYRFFESMIDTGVLDARQALNLATSADCYALYQRGVATLSPVPGAAYWGESPVDSLPAWPPSVSGTPISLGKTWLIAMVAVDPLRQTPALEMALWLSSPSAQSRLAQAVEMLPSRRTAVQAWERTLAEKQFLDALLSGTVKSPPPQVDYAVRRALQSGLAILLTDPTTTPEDAAAYALTSLRQ